MPVTGNQITDDCIRQNAISDIVWFGRDAEAVALDRAKSVLAAGEMIGVENVLRRYREFSGSWSRTAKA